MDRVLEHVVVDERKSYERLIWVVKAAELTIDSKMEQSKQLIMKMLGDDVAQF